MNHFEVAVVGDHTIRAVNAERVSVDEVWGVLFLRCMVGDNPVFCVPVEKLLWVRKVP